MDSLLYYSVALSDNQCLRRAVALCRRSRAVEQYIHQLGITDVRLSATEDDMHRQPGRVTDNSATPEAISRAVPPVPARGTVRSRLPQLPVPGPDLYLHRDEQAACRTADHAILGHKTGSSDRTPDGVKTADNDAGFVLLPDGQRYYITVLVTNSLENDSVNAAIIATLSHIVCRHLGGSPSTILIHKPTLRHEQRLATPYPGTLARRRPASENHRYHPRPSGRGRRLHAEEPAGTRPQQPRPHGDAVQVLLSIESEGTDDPMWYYRLGYAYYYLHREEEALPLFQRAYELAPDEDTQRFIDLCEQGAPQPGGPVMYSEEEQTAIEQHIARYFGPNENVFHELISYDIHVDIYIVEPTPERNYYTLVTGGMGHVR